MKLWMAVMRDIESVMNSYKTAFDAWAEGGVDGIVIGPLVFNTPMLLPGAVSKGTDAAPVAAFDPTSGADSLPL